MCRMGSNLRFIFSEAVRKTVSVVFLFPFFLARYADKSHHFACVGVHEGENGAFSTFVCERVGSCRSLTKV